MLPEALDAAVIYYGRVVTEPEQLAPLMMPILGIFGGQDRGIPIESVRQFETMLQTLGKTAEIVVYEEADHAFANPSGTRYEPEAAADAWRRTLEFLAEHL
jgi:carboxymethylenebutenolidase